MNYSYKRQIEMNFTDAVSRVRSTLADEGFGILTEIDVKSAFKEKLGIDYKDYIILGACNPTFAHKALEADKEIGLLLPCNVIVYEDDGEVFVSSIVPSVAMDLTENDRLSEVADAVEEKLKKAIDNV